MSHKICAQSEGVQSPITRPLPGILRLDIVIQLMVLLAVER